MFLNRSGFFTASGAGLNSNSNSLPFCTYFFNAAANCCDCGIDTACSATGMISSSSSTCCLFLHSLLVDPKSLLGLRNPASLCSASVIALESAVAAFVVEDNYCI